MIKTSLRVAYEKKRELLSNHNKFVAELPKSDSVESLLSCMDEIIKAGLSVSAEYIASQQILRSRNLFTNLNTCWHPRENFEWIVGARNCGK